MANCEYCGAKPTKGGKIRFHKKGCPLLPVKAAKAVHVPSAEVECPHCGNKFSPGKVSEATAVLDSKHKLCGKCGVMMLRINCGGLGIKREAQETCLHGRFLVEECDKCRDMHGGSVLWRCPVCQASTYDGAEAAPAPSNLTWMPRGVKFNPAEMDDDF